MVSVTVVDYSHQLHGPVDDCDFVVIANGECTDLRQLAQQHLLAETVAEKLSNHVIIHDNGIIRNFYCCHA